MKEFKSYFSEISRFLKKITFKQMASGQPSSRQNNKQNISNPVEQYRKLGTGVNLNKEKKNKNSQL